MGNSASASLFYGVDLGASEDYESGVPAWLLPHATDADEPAYTLEPAFKNSGVELYHYGYHDNANLAIGVKFAWAIDWGSAVVDPVKLPDRIARAREKIKAVLLKLGAPTDLKLKLLILAEES